MEFSKVQSRIISNSLTCCGIAGILLCIGFFGWIALAILRCIAPALIPVLVGLFLSMLFKPYYMFIKSWLKNPTLSLVVMLASVILPLSLVAWFFGTIIAAQWHNLVSTLPGILENSSASLRASIPNLPDFLDPTEVVKSLLSGIAGSAGSAAVAAGTTAMTWLCAFGKALLALVFFVFFLLTDDVTGESLVSQLPFLKDQTASFVREQVDTFISIITSFYRRQVVICLIEGCYYGLAFFLAGLDYGFVLGFMLGLLNLVPLLGSVVCMPLAILLAMFGSASSTVLVVSIVLLWLLGLVLDGYVITPRVQGKNTGLGSAGVIFSFVLWGMLLPSVLGLFLAIPLSAFCVVLWKAIKARYIRQII